MRLVAPTPTRTTPRRPWPRGARARPGRRSTWPPSPTTPRVLAELVKPAELCAVVKAHGYGHGGPAVARAALAGGAQRLAVALVDEGVELRLHGVTAPVLLLSECGADAVETALAYGLTPTLYSAEGIEAFAARGAGGRPRRRRSTSRSTPGCTGSAARPRTCRRSSPPSGASRRCSSRACGRTCRSPTARRRRTAPTPRGSWTSSTASSPAWPPTASRVPVLHAANTAGAVAFARSRHDMVRCGIGLYGYLPGDAVRAAFDAQAAGARLLPAMSLKARVVAVRTLPAGERPSYGRLRPLPARVARGDGADRLRRRGAPRACSAPATRS